MTDSLTFWILFSWCCGAASVYAFRWANRPDRADHLPRATKLLPITPPANDDYEAYQVL